MSNDLISRKPLLNDLDSVIAQYNWFSGKIYQYGNYSDGEWWEIGSTGGYA